MRTKSLLTCLVTLLGSGLQGSPPYLWEGRTRQFQQLLWKSELEMPEGYSGGIMGSILVPGTCIATPLYRFTSHELQSPKETVLAVLECTNCWCQQIGNDSGMNKTFRLLCFRPLFPSGCSIQCAEDLSKQRHTITDLFQGMLVWHPQQGSPFQYLPVQEALDQFGSKEDWPDLRKATAAWLEHPRLTEEEVGILLDEELQHRAERLAQDSTMALVPPDWVDEPGVRLLQHLESLGFVVLSVSLQGKESSWLPWKEKNLPHVTATLGSRKALTKEETFHLGCQCIEFLQELMGPILPPSKEEMKKWQHRGDQLQWLQNTRVPAHLYVNIPASEKIPDSPITLIVSPTDIEVTVFPSMMTPDKASQTSWYLPLGGERWVIPEDCPRLKTLCEELRGAD